MTSHAAVVARGMGRAMCFRGWKHKNRLCEINFLKLKNIEVKEGDIITIDGSTGEVMLGEVKTIQSRYFWRFFRNYAMG